MASVFAGGALRNTSTHTYRLSRPEPETQAAPQVPPKPLCLCRSCALQRSAWVWWDVPWGWDSAPARPEPRPCRWDAVWSRPPLRKYLTPRAVCSVLSRLPRGPQGARPPAPAGHCLLAVLGSDLLGARPQGICPGGAALFLLWPFQGPGQVLRTLLGGRQCWSQSLRPGLRSWLSTWPARETGLHGSGSARPPGQGQ